METISQLWNSLKEWIPSGAKTISAVYSWLDTLSPAIKKWLTFMLMIGTKVAAGQSLLGLAVNLVADFALPAMGVTADFTALAFVNYLFPFDTLCEFLIAYAVLRLACAAFRITKSFVPTIA